MKETLLRRMPSPADQDSLYNRNDESMLQNLIGPGTWGLGG